MKVLKGWVSLAIYIGDHTVEIEITLVTAKAS